MGVPVRLGVRFMLINETDMVIADLHLGKTSHFRKSGVAIPAYAKELDFIRLENLLLRYEPERVLLLGDLFHSDFNPEWQRFVELTNRFDETQFVLIEGNHDVLAPHHYEAARLECMTSLDLGPLHLTHEPMEAQAGRLNVHGHVHPGIRLVGQARQSMSIPCFHISESHVCVPAFGSLTGLSLRKAKKGDRIFAVMEEGVFDVSNC